MQRPFIKPIQINTETCFGSHLENKDGKFVHSAIAAGCEGCHRVSSGEGRTSVTPVAAGAELCGACHQLTQAPVVHGPYKDGLCLVCHDPHTSSYPRQARADTNTLCMTCHGVNQPDVKINSEARTVTVLGRQTLTLAAYRETPKIGLDLSGASAHPIMGHPLVGRDPRRKAGTLSCLSCHTAHSSRWPRLLPPDVKPDVGQCA